MQRMRVRSVKPRRILRFWHAAGRSDRVNAKMCRAIIRPADARFNTRSARHTNFNQCDTSSASQDTTRLERKRDAHAGRSTTSRKQAAGMCPATYDSSCKYGSCYSGQRASSLHSPSVSFDLALCLSSFFFLPSFASAYVPACLTCCFLTCFPAFPP